MGLDMYLSARKHINKINWNKLDRNGDVKYSEATDQQWFDVVNAAGVDTLVDVESIYGVDVSVNVGYWRKSNQIHKDRKSTRLNSSHVSESRMPSSA